MEGYDSNSDDSCSSDDMAVLGNIRTKDNLYGSTPKNTSSRGFIYLLTSKKLAAEETFKLCQRALPITKRVIESLNSGHDCSLDEKLFVFNYWVVGDRHKWLEDLLRMYNINQIVGDLYKLSARDLGEIAFALRHDDTSTRTITHTRKRDELIDSSITRFPFLRSLQFCSRNNCCIDPKTERRYFTNFLENYFLSKVVPTFERAEREEYLNDSEALISGKATRLTKLVRAYCRRLRPYITPRHRFFGNIINNYDNDKDEGDYDEVDDNDNKRIIVV